jgi:hypothetical protein
MSSYISLDVMKKVTNVTISEEVDRAVDSSQDIMCTKLDIYVFISKISYDRKESITMQNSQFT